MSVFNCFIKVMHGLLVHRFGLVWYHVLFCAFERTPCTCLHESPRCTERLYAKSWFWSDIYPSARIFASFWSFCCYLLFWIRILSLEYSLGSSLVELTSFTQLFRICESQWAKPIILNLFVFVIADWFLLQY